jgi:hypothetical protein
MADGAADIVALETRCEQEREGEIAPLREAEIRKCKTEKKEAEYCEKYWADYGNAVPNPTGGMMPRLFGDLPSCIAAFKARQDFELKGH